MGRLDDRALDFVVRERGPGMTYARSLHLVTIHRATQIDDKFGRVDYGARPRHNSWYGQDEWRFSTEIPASEGAWKTTPPEELLCKSCCRTKK
jgi:hypothetical protein